MKKDKILVIGANGTIGSGLVKSLQALGFPVRATTSKEGKVSEGVEFVQVDLVKGVGIENAFKDIDRAFLISPPNNADQFKILNPLIQQAKKSKLKKVVLMTAMGANASEETPFRKAEVELEKSGIPYNIIRPNWFMQNFHTFWGSGIKTNSNISLPAGSASVSFIHTQDVSEVAAKLLTSEEHNNKDFDLSGGVALTHEQVAAELSKLLGRTITYNNIEPKTLGATLLSWGLDAAYVDFMLLIFSFLREGYNERQTNNVELLLGKKPRSFQECLNEYKAQWA